MRTTLWDFLVVQGLKNSLCNAVDVSLIPGWGTKIPQAVEQKEFSFTDGENAPPLAILEDSLAVS